MAKILKTKVHVFIIIGSSNINDAYVDYATATAYYHYLTNLQIPSNNIHCFCKSNFFDGFQDPQHVLFHKDNQNIRKYPSIKDKFSVFDLKNLPKIQDDQGLAYVFLFDNSSQSGFYESQVSYWEILFSFFTSTQVSQFVFVDSSPNSGLLIETYKNLQNIIELIQQFPNNIPNSLITLFFLLLSYESKALINLQKILKHLQLSDILCLDRELLDIVYKIGNLFLSTTYPSYTHFIENIQNISYTNQFSNFSEFKTNSLFVSKLRLEFREEFLLITTVTSKFSLDEALNIFRIILNSSYFDSFSSLIALITKYKESQEFQIKVENSLKLSNYLTPVKIFTSSDSHSKSSFYPKTLINFNGSEKETTLGSAFRSFILKNLIKKSILKFN